MNPRVHSATDGARISLSEVGIFATTSGGPVDEPDESKSDKEIPADEDEG